MTDLLRIAIVGFGEIAGRQHLPAIAKTSGAAVVAVVDPVKTPPGLPHFRDLQELLRDGPEIDAVALCTPPQARHLQAATLSPRASMCCWRSRRGLRSANSRH